MFSYSQIGKNPFKIHIWLKNEWVDNKCNAPILKFEFVIIVKFELNYYNNYNNTQCVTEGISAHSHNGEIEETNVHLKW